MNEQKPNSEQKDQNLHVSQHSSNEMLPVGFGYIIKFGKHKGKSLAQILDEDYGYIIWLSEENALPIDEKVTGMAYDLQNEDDDDYSWADWHDMF